MTDTVETQARGGCQDAPERLTALLDNALAADETAATQAHLAVCTSCRQEYEGLARTRNLAAQWTVGDAPDLWPAVQSQMTPAPEDDMRAELRRLRAEVARLRRELAARPAPVSQRSTALDLPYVPKVSDSRFQIV